MDLKEFKEIASKAHNNFYNYDKTIINKNCLTVTITCPIHGDVEVSLYQHIKGKGKCPKCCGKNRTTDDWVKLAEFVHNKKYNYSKTKFINNNTDVIITCSKHGDFLQKPYKHILNKHGCPKCAEENKFLTKEEFVNRANKIHNGKYSYDNLIYTKMADKLSYITCPIHGDFEQMGTNHLLGCGCPKCNNSKLELEINKLLTEKGVEFEEQKMFEWLKNEKKLTLDFYLPQHNIAIECQGKQHFQPIEFLGGEKEFEKRTLLDKLKFSLCKEHGINILYFSNLGIEYPYQVFEDKSLLLEEINKHAKETK